LRRESGAASVRCDQDGTVHIGTLATLRELEQSALLARCAPVLVEALHRVANPRIRNMATLGGHLAYGEPHLDLPPVLLAMGASVRLKSRKRERVLVLEDFFQGYYATALEPDELLLEVMFPGQLSSWQGSYSRSTAAAADDWPMLGLATFLRMEGARIAEVRLVASGVQSTPTRLRIAEQLLLSDILSPSLASQAARSALEPLEVHDDVRGSGWYKKEILEVMVRRAVAQLTGAGQ